MDKNVIVLLIFVSVTLSLFSGCIEEESVNEKPLVEITYPHDGMIVSGLVMISGVAGQGGLCVVRASVERAPCCARPEMEGAVGDHEEEITYPVSVRRRNREARLVTGPLSMS